MMRAIIEQYWKDRHFEADYQLVNTPHIGRAELWKTSGHLGFYSESMYAPIEVEGQDYYLKPMNCPFHIMIYKSTLRSYRELPVRYAEMGTVYRYERSGTLHGLMRVRGFTQDDAHPHLHGRADERRGYQASGLLAEHASRIRFRGVLRYTLATKPEKSVGEEKDWLNAQEALEMALKGAKIDYELDEGGGAFYGPKIDIKVKDSLNRLWQLSTIQFDFNLPERFDMEYIGADNQPHRPYMVHRALLGSLERFLRNPDRVPRGEFPDLALPGAGDGSAHLGELRALRRTGTQEAAKVRHPRAARRPQREDRLQDPRRRTQEDTVHVHPRSA